MRDDRDIKALCLRMPVELYEQVKKVADASHLNMTAYILSVLKGLPKPGDPVKELNDRVQVLEANVKFLKERWGRLVVTLRKIYDIKDDLGE